MLGEAVKATVIPSDDSLKEGQLCMLLEGMCRRKSPQIPSLTPRHGGEGGEKASGLHCSCMCLKDMWQNKGREYDNQRFRTPCYMLCLRVVLYCLVHSGSNRLTKIDR